MPPQKGAPMKYQKGMLRLLMGILSAEGAGDTINLSGTAGAPNNSTQIILSPGSAIAGWDFQIDGKVFFWDNGVLVQFITSPAEWNQDQVNPTTDYWLRFTLDSGDAAGTVIPSVGTWGVISGGGESVARIQWNQSGVGSQTGIYKTEIATDSAGADIIATGFYEGLADVFTL